MSGGLWGLGPSGEAPWGGGGGGGGGSVSISNALATSPHTVLVGATGALRAVATLGSGDALNPASWAVTRADTGASFTVLAVRYVDATNVELYLLEPLGPFGVTHTATAVGVYDATGALLVAPLSADFAGMTVAAASANGPARGVIDLRNDAVGSGLAGVLRTASNGDYDTHGGTELLRKLILRRLTTRPGEFAHLDPDTYGVGLVPKQPLPTRDLLALQQTIERQVQREAEIDAADAQLSLARDGTLTVTVRVRTRAGAELPFVYKIPVGGVTP